MLSRSATSRRFGARLSVLALISATTILLLTTAAAHAQARLALVIGNGAYRHVAALPNPPNDASDIAAALSRLGFSLTRVTDGDLATMRASLAVFGQRARGSEMAVVFFAGHGMEIGGENWLIPIDARLQSDSDAETQSINLQAVLASIAEVSKLGLVVLDACRDNPFAATMTRTIRARSVDKGFSRFEPRGDVLVAYAAKDGSTARDGVGRNSPFSAALLKHVETPGLELNFLFRRVRDDVLAATNREQFPYVYGSLSQNEVYLRPATGAVAGIAPRLAQQYPTRAIKLVVAFAQGGPTDIMGRAIAEGLSGSLGQPVIVENITGGNGTEGTRAVAKAPPDGHTLLLGDTVTHGINPTLLRATGYDPHNDFEAVGLLGSAHLALVVPGSSPAKSVEELSALLRADPQRATYTSAGRGSLSHLVAEHFASAVDVKLLAVPFAGEAPAIQGLIGAQARFHFSSFAAAIGLAKSGGLRVLAVTGPKRATGLAEVPSLAEAGLPGFSAVRNYGLLIPAGTPRDIVDRLNAALGEALATAGVRARLASLGVEPIATSPDRYASMIDREIAKWSRIMWRAGIDPNR